MSVYVPTAELPTSCMSCRMNYGEKRPEYGQTIACSFSDGSHYLFDVLPNGGKLQNCKLQPMPNAIIAVYFAKYDEEHTYFTEDPPEKVEAIASAHLFSSIESFAMYWLAIRDRPEDLWYWVVDLRSGECICSGACDPYDEEIFDEDFGSEFSDVIRLYEKALQQGMFGRSDMPAEKPNDSKVGKWIVDEKGIVICPNCGEEHEWESFRASYCDNCGARLLPEDGYDEKQK